MWSFSVRVSLLVVVPHWSTESGSCYPRVASVPLVHGLSSVLLLASLDCTHSLSVVNLYVGKPLMYNSVHRFRQRDNGLRWYTFWYHRQTPITRRMLHDRRTGYHYQALTSTSVSSVTPGTHERRGRVRTDLQGQTRSQTLNTYFRRRKADFFPGPQTTNREMLAALVGAVLIVHSVQNVFAVQAEDSLKNLTRRRKLFLVAASSQEPACCKTRGE